MNKPWCVYRTSHPSGHFYQGKGKTHLVEEGKYTGSGVRYNLALKWPGFEPQTWTTKIIETFATEDEAYAAEEALVTHESLANPFCLNMMCGGRKGKYKTPSSLLRKYKSEAKRERAADERKRKAQKEAERKAKIKADKERAAAKLREAKAAARSRVSKRSTQSRAAKDRAEPAAN